MFHRIPTNGGPTTNGLKNLGAWLGKSKWDVIHFNWGLHDLKYVLNHPAKIVPVDTAGSHYQVSLKNYEKRHFRRNSRLPTRTQRSGKLIAAPSDRKKPRLNDGLTP